MSKHIFFYIQNLLGIGHARRAASIARALQDKGFRVTVASGAPPLETADYGDVTWVQLPCVRASDATFKTLIDETGTKIDASWKKRRFNALMKSWTQAGQVDAVLIESFPFGRRQFRFELLPFLGAIHACNPRPLVFSSFRDILVTKDRMDRNVEIAETAIIYFDRLLIHGDPKLIPLQATFPLADQIEYMVEYTGYVTRPSHQIGQEMNQNDDASSDDGTEEIIVSVGGGAMGLSLLSTAIDAAGRLTEKLGSSAPVWRLLAGPDVSTEDYDSLRSHRSSHLLVERARPDFPDLLARCKLSISQGGYNTVMDILSAKCPAIVVPFAKEKETEQLTRAKLLAERGLINLLEEENLSSQNLCDLVHDILANSNNQETQNISIDTNGAQKTADIIGSFLLPEAQTCAANG